jgi:rod shape-determining protein MreC
LKLVFMESVLGRYRNLVILVGVLFLQVLGLAMQVKRTGNDAENTRLIRIWAVGAITPFERTLVWAQNSTGNLWHNYFYLRGVRAENRQLKEQIEQMRIEQVRLSEDAAQARRLQTLLAFKEQFISKTVAAQVIGSSGSDLSRIIYIDKGENVGIQRDMAVMTSDGIVGKVLVVYPSVSQVLLISDQSSGVGAILEKTRLQGVLRGTANGEVVLERVMSDEQVPVGETVLTSGGDQVFPKGLPVGTVTKVGSGKDLFLNIKIKPAANLSKLEEVLVLVEKQEKQATAEGNVHVRAADILAQRLPSVPDRPAQDATATNAPKAGTKASTTTTSKPASTVSTTVPAIKNPSVAEQAAKPVDRTATTQKAPDATNTAGTSPKPDASQTKPARVQPEPSQSIVPIDPATQPITQPATQPGAPPANSQPPAAENSPQ